MQPKSPGKRISQSTSRNPEKITQKQKRGYCVARKNWYYSSRIKQEKKRGNS